MYVRDLIASLLRRWYLLLTGLLLTAALCVGAYLFVPLSYDGKGSMLLLPPSSSVGARGNPYLYLGGLAQAVEVLSARMNSDEVLKPIADAHPDATITVGPDAETTGPILAVTVTASSAAETTQIVDAITAAVPGTLTQMQDQLQVPEASTIGVMKLTADITVTESAKNRNRAVIALAGVGVAGTLLLVGLIDGLLLGRLPKLRRAVAPAPGWKVSSGGSPPEPDESTNHRAPAGEEAPQRQSLDS